MWKCFTFSPFSALTLNRSLCERLLAFTLFYCNGRLTSDIQAYYPCKYILVNRKWYNAILNCSQWCQMWYVYRTLRRVCRTTQWNSLPYKLLHGYRSGFHENELIHFISILKDKYIVYYSFTLHGISFVFIPILFQ